MPLFAVYNFRKNNLWGSSFVSKYSKFYVAFGNAEKNWKNMFWFGDNCTWIRCVKHSLLLRENICRRVSMSWQTVPRFQILLNINFSADFLSEWSGNMGKTPLWRFKQSFGPFKMLTVHKCSDTGLFGHLTNSAFCSL